MVPLKKWWLTQASIAIVKDDELLILMKKSGCIGVFLGLETFSEDYIVDANKQQNRISEYKIAIDTLHKHGIAVIAGFISGFDNDTYESIINMSDNLMNLGVDVPFLSIITPFVGTDLYSKLKKENRLLGERDWSFYNGYNVTFIPNNLTPESLIEAHRKLWCDVFSIMNSFYRILRSFTYLRIGAFLLSLFMNSFYGIKRSRNNFPKEMKVNENL